MKKVLIENKSVAISDTKTTFGIGSISRPTPEVATKIFRVVLYVAGVVNIVLMTISEIPEPVKATVGKYSVEAVMLVHALTKLFGLKEVK